MLIEPVQAEGGDNHFRKEFFREIRALADENEFLFIVDEVQTGLGLTGKMWAYEHMDVLPDVLSFGKRTQVCGTRSVRFRPSLTIKREDVDEGLEITRRALGSIQT